MKSDPWRHIKVRESVKNKIMNECKEEFLRNNPKFEGMYLSQGFLTQKIVDYYLEG